MKTTIYDYDNTPVEVEIPDGIISAIFVQVASGDEVVDFVVDGKSYHFDSSDCRMIAFNDGAYTVTGEDIFLWLNWEPNEVQKDRTYSYTRQCIFE